jgi:hypothetical protein
MILKGNSLSKQADKICTIYSTQKSGCPPTKLPNVSNTQRPSQGRSVSGYRKFCENGHFVTFFLLPNKNPLHLPCGKSQILTNISHPKTNWRKICEKKLVDNFWLGNLNRQRCSRLSNRKSI